MHTMTYIECVALVEVLEGDELPRLAAHWGVNAEGAEWELRTRLLEHAQLSAFALLPDWSGPRYSCPTGLTMPAEWEA